MISQGHLGASGSCSPGVLRGGVLTRPPTWANRPRTVEGTADKQQVRADIREFLTTRRARITPAQAGLRVYGSSRRVAGLRREEVATLAGISAEYYTRLERGNVTGASEGVLDGIAQALQLTDDERAHLNDLVQTAGSNRPAARRRPPQARVRPTVQPRGSAP